MISQTSGRRESSEVIFILTQSPLSEKGCIAIRVHRQSRQEGARGWAAVGPPRGLTHHLLRSSSFFLTKLSAALRVHLPESSQAGPCSTAPHKHPHSPSGCCQLPNYRPTILPGMLSQRDLQLQTHRPHPALTARLSRSKLSTLVSATTSGWLPP